MSYNSLIFYYPAEGSANVASNGIDPGQEGHSLGPGLRPGDVWDVGEGCHVESGGTTKKILDIKKYFYLFIF